MIEKSAFLTERVDISERLSALNKCFDSKVKSKNGIYGIQRIDKGNGIEALQGKNDLGHSFIEYYKDGSLFSRRESLGNQQTLKIDYDDNEKEYLKTLYKSGKRIQWKLSPDTIIKKGNFTAQTDAYGRPVLNKITDLSLKEGGYHQVTNLKDGYHLEGDEVGHLIPDQFGGPASKENVVSQAREVNRGAGSKIRQVENIVAKLKRDLKNHTVDYEIKTNYQGTRNTRPTSFEPKITVDGREYQLADDLKKIYNTADDSFVQKTILTTKEKFGIANEVGIKSGGTAAGLTFAISMADNIAACINGEISGEEAAGAIVKDTAVASGAAYGTAFISTTISKAMQGSAKTLLNSIGKSCFPATVATFAVDAADSAIGYAQGEIDETELAYDLGNSAVAVSGGTIGMKTGFAIGSAILPGVGSGVGSIIGGVLGTIVASEAYATVLESGAEGARVLGNKAEEFANSTVELVKEHIPDKLNDVKTAFNDFAGECKLPFNV